MRRILPVVLLLSACRGGLPPADLPVPPGAFFQVQDLFVAGQGGYASYRIPAIATTRRGVLVAVVEARKGGAGDWGSIDLVFRRSLDGGKTWEPQRKLLEPPAGLVQNPASKQRKPGELTLHNPVLVPDRAGTLHVLVCGEYQRCWLLRSLDDGATFSAPTDLTPVFEEFRKDYDWKVLATGPGHGIQLAMGRLVVPVWLSTGQGSGAHRPSAVATIASDDAGRTWKRGAVIAKPPALQNPSESTLVELDGGGVMISMRTEQPEMLRAVSRSADGLTGWSPPALDSWLPETVCEGSLLRISRSGGGAKSRILYTAPHNPGRKDRKNLTVKLTLDEGRTWPVYRVIEEGPAGYSDLAMGADGTLFCLFEKGAAPDAYHPKTVTLARFNLEWVSGEQDRLERAR
jgi:sialidase-1